ncbi:MAG: hypothetical protein ACYTDY_13555 [Planctomycetota bacterium]|jgi:hypothetical protein
MALDGLAPGLAHPAAGHAGARARRRLGLVLRRVLLPGLRGRRLRFLVLGRRGLLGRLLGDLLRGRLGLRGSLHDGLDLLLLGLEDAHGEVVGLLLHRLRLGLGRGGLQRRLGADVVGLRLGLREILWLGRRLRRLLRLRLVTVVATPNALHLGLDLGEPVHRLLCPGGLGLRLDGIGLRLGTRGGRPGPLPLSGGRPAPGPPRLRLGSRRRILVVDPSLPGGDRFAIHRGLPGDPPRGVLGGRLGLVLGGVDVAFGWGLP